MNLTCPSCATTFVVDLPQLGPNGRQVRCGSCGHSWFQAAAPEAEGAVPPPPADAPAEAAASERPARRRGPRPPRPAAPEKGRSSLVLGWVLFLFVVAGLAAGLYFGRDQVIALVPSAAPLYQMAGLGPATPGTVLELRDVRTMRRVLDGEQVVVVEGLVANVSGEPQTIPMLRASLTDATGKEVENWTFAAGATALPAGGSTGFETTTKNPPNEGRIVIDFVSVE